MNFSMRMILPAFVLSVLTAGPLAADQRVFDALMYGGGDIQPAVGWLDAGGDPGIRNASGAGGTLMHWAGLLCETDLARMLLDRGVDVDSALPDGGTALMHVSQKCSPEDLRFFLENGADPLRTTDIGLSALHMWARSGNPESLHLLLDAGADPLLAVNAPEKPYHGGLPLDTLLGNGHADVLKTAPGMRFLRLTYEGTGCEGIVTRERDSKLSLLAARTLGDASRWPEIMKLNGLEGKSYRIGDCLRLPGMPDL